jgi:hypothetical protein
MDNPLLISKPDSFGLSIVSIKCVGYLTYFLSFCSVVNGFAKGNDHLIKVVFISVSEVSILNCYDGGGCGIGGRQVLAGSFR